MDTSEEILSQEFDRSDTQDDREYSLDIEDWADTQYDNYLNSFGE